jgi:hypothetical protein
MATVIFTAVGTILGGPVGGVIGALAGSQVDSALFSSSSNVQGARLTELSVTSSSYGSAIPRHFGSMRVAGSVIWSTDLAEHSRTSGGGKGSPSLTSYTYTGSFAVALSSRPISNIGRIWADGKLLRGAAGDLKVGGSMRIHSGHKDQSVDPLIASAVGAAMCPAFRGLAYVVFEDLDLSNYGNRIPSLTFEVIADEGPLSLEPLFDDLNPAVDAAIALDGLTGYSDAGTYGQTLKAFQPIIPMLCDAGGEGLTLQRQRLQTAPIALGTPAIAQQNGEFGKGKGYSLKRQQSVANPPNVIRYYDTGLDYQPGTQRSPGQPRNGKPVSIDVPAAMSAQNAFQFITSASCENIWSQEMVLWRASDINPTVAPGAIVTTDALPGHWRVVDWELRDTGVDLTLVRIAPGVSGDLGDTMTGLSATSTDLPTASTAIVAFDIPWDGSSSLDPSMSYAAVSATTAQWQGAALYADKGNGALIPLGASGRQRNVIGTATQALAAASPLVVDRTNSVVVQLIGEDLALSSATMRQMAEGANLALMGREFIQFGEATALGNGLWQLSFLLRGRGGTEFAVDAHTVGEPFALLDGAATPLAASSVGSLATTKIGALGANEAQLTESSIVNKGIGLRPLAPVHPVAGLNSDGSLQLSWTRRSRGGWQWDDNVDVPLNEEAELYQVSLWKNGTNVANWQTPNSSFNIEMNTLSMLRNQFGSASITVSQTGKYLSSLPVYFSYAL